MEKKERIGRHVKSPVSGGEYYESYIPKPLPPKPPLLMDELYPLLEKANIALGRLDGIHTILPDSSLLLYMYVRKEAVLSSQIEGTQSSLSQLLLYEVKDSPGVLRDNDAAQASRCVSAMYYGLERLKNFPLSLRLIREIHGELMRGVRGGDMFAGEFRTSQNWVGGSRPANARYVPPPAENLMECLDNFERFLHEETRKSPVLIKAALAHAQFETIHPFIGGNGRVGRLLITFILCAEGILKQPLLYLSLYFKVNRQAYYDCLQGVRETGDWEAWVSFFLEGVIETAGQAEEAVRTIIDLFERDRRRIEESGKSTSGVLNVYDHLKRFPVSDTHSIRNSFKTSHTTVLRSLRFLESLEIVREITGRDRNKLFVYREYMNILEKGTEPVF